MFETFRLKIIDKTYANHTGQIGPISFVDGISVHKVMRYGAVAFNAGYRCVIVDDDGHTIAEFVNGQLRMSAAESAPRTMTQLELELPTETAETVESEAPVNPYSRKMLEAIADDLGLRGLREIGELVGIRGKSIPQLIERILKK